MTRLFASLCCGLLALPLTSVNAALATETKPDRPEIYTLEPQELAPGCYAVIGSTAYFNRENGGNIVNSGFIVTGKGVVVIDTGPSRLYGEAFRAAIARITDEKIVRVINTHLHPDHVFGNQAFSDVPVLSGPLTREDVQAFGDDFAANLYRLVGNAMRGTEWIAPRDGLKDGTETIGSHRLRTLMLSGHSREDVALLDETCGVLFAQDLVFHDRTPTTPHASLSAWVASLDRLDQLDFDIVLPGHGPAAGAPGKPDHSPLSETRDYLLWLDQALQEAAEAGLDQTEVMELPIPDRFAGMSLAREEFQRSVTYLYPALERAALPVITGEGGQ